jgi:transcriptional regulator with XRE-family HTH domain
MRVGEKLRYLRNVEGTLRGLDREMTQQAVVDAIWKEQRKRISQSYLSQIERGQRKHLTNDTRMILSRFFNVHPGYLVDDPDGFHTELTSDIRTVEDNLDLWLINGAERFENDPEIGRALLSVARHPDSRRCLILLDAILENEGLAERLLQVLRPSGLDAVEKSDSAKGRGVTR